MGEGGIVGKDGDSPFGELHHVPFMIRDAGAARAGETSGYFRIYPRHRPTLLSAAGVTRSRMRTGSTCMPLFDRRRPPARHVFTAGYGDHVLAGDDTWLMLADNQGREKRLYRRADQSRDVAPSEPESCAACGMRRSRPRWRAAADVRARRRPLGGRHVGSG